MRIKAGTAARFTLADGTTIEATARRQWWPWASAFRVEGAVFFDARTAEPVPAAGALLIPKHAVLFVQLDTGKDGE